MNLITHTCRISVLILFAAILFVLPQSPTYASTNGTIEIQTTVQEGFIEPITVELSGKDEYQAKLLITVDNGYVLRKQLPNGTYTVSALYTNSKEESDSQMWANTNTVSITAGKTTVLEIAVFDDADSKGTVLFGEENNPFRLPTQEHTEDFLEENASKLESESQEPGEEMESAAPDKSESGRKETPKQEGDGEQKDAQTEDNNEKQEEKSEKQTAFEKLIDLVIRLARYILLSVFIMLGVSCLVWVYRKFKYGE